MQQLWTEIDSDKSGNVDFEEFSTFVMGVEPAKRALKRLKVMQEEIDGAVKGGIA